MAIPCKCLDCLCWRCFNVFCSHELCSFTWIESNKCFVSDCEKAVFVFSKERSIEIVEKGE